MGLKRSGCHSSTHFSTNLVISCYLNEFSYIYSLGQFRPKVKTREASTMCFKAEHQPSLMMILNYHH